MASKRDLVEAHDFNRRRLVTAFLSGAPGGREVEPVRYGRTIIGGLVLAALLVAGAAVTGVLKPTVDDNWRDNGLVIGKQSGSRYLMFDDQLYPVINIASARLALKGEVKISYVPDDILVKEPKRNAIGILMGVELVLNAANVNLVAYNRFAHGTTANGATALDGQIFALFVIVIAAAEAAVALAIFLNFYNNFASIDVERAANLKG